MEHHRKYAAILVLFLSALLPVFSNSDRNNADYRFEQMNFPDRMNSSISGITQDSKGFMWFATQSGLYRYDGYKLENYTNDPFNSESISHNLIQTLYTDSDGIFWLGTYGGLNRFDPSTEKASSYEKDPDNPSSLSNEVVTSVMMDDSGALWVGTLDGLNKLNIQTGEFTRFFNDKEDESSLPHNSVRDIVKDNLGRLWFGTYSGLALYRPDTEDFATWEAGDSENTFHSPYIMSIIQDPENSDLLWLGSWDGGISSFSISTGKIRNYILPDNRIYRILIDSKGRLWAASWGGGLIEFDRETGDSQIFCTEDDNGFIQDVVYSLFEDASGILWIGTNGGGIIRLKDWENQYKHFEHQSSDKNSLGPGKVLDILETDDGDIWFGLYDGGISRLDHSTGEFVNFRHDEDIPESLSNDIVNKLFVDSQGTFWAATNEGLNIYDENNDTFKPFLLDTENPAPVIYDIIETSEGELWFGRYLDGLTILDRNYNTVGELRADVKDPNSLSDNLVRSILQQGDGKIWIGTNKGLNLYDPATGRFKHYFHDQDDRSTISSDNIYELYLDADERLWIATQGGGINLFDSETESFTYFLDQDGLSSNMVHTINQTADGDFLISGKLGLSIYNEITGTFRNIDSRSGLLSDELTSNVLIVSDGSYYIGGNKGVTIIQPDNEAEDLFTPQLVLTGLNVLGEPFSETIHPWNIHELTLKHDQNYISFEFAAMDFSLSANNNYAYILEGFDEDWNYSETRNYATYTNLQPGSYIFKFIGSGSMDNWNEDAGEILIEVLSPFWKTRIALFIYIIILALISFLFVTELRKRARQNKMLLAKRESDNFILEKTVRERTFEIEEARKEAEAAAVAKSRFLANMSHEIRTPLNAIIGFTDLIMETEINEQQQEYISNITNSSNFLLNTINEILDFSKIEAGKVSLEDAPFNMRDIFHDLDILFSVSASKKNLRLSIFSEDNVPSVIQGDQHRLKQILHNLISNAIKFTEKGQVSVRIFMDDSDNSRICFEVSDTGIGIAEEKIKRLFESFNQADTSTSRIYGGTGLGLSITKQLVDAMGGVITVQSKEGRGSVFRACIPFKQVESHSVSSSADRDIKLTGFKAKPGQKILAVEDNQLNQMVIKGYLIRLGFNVVIVENGKVCLEELKLNNDYDLILMDIQMPELDGNATTKLIRESGITIPIVAMSAHIFEEEKQESLAVGMNAYLSKPIRFSELKTVLNEQIGSAAKLPAQIGSLNVEAILNDHENDQYFTKMILSSFYTRIKEIEPKIIRAAEESNWVELAVLVHSLRGMAGLVESEELFKLTEEVEAEINGSELEEVPARFGELLSQVRMLIESLVEYKESFQSIQEG